MAKSCSVAVAAPEGITTGEEDVLLVDADLNEQDRLFQKCLRSRLEREARRKKELQEKKEADERKRKEALDNAFDNEVDKVLQFLEEGWPIETADAYGSTLLGEAAAGGAGDCVEALLGSGANPNTIGRNKWTPVWRAANAGHAQVLQSILRGGGDPRIPDASGVLPYQVANGPEVKMLLECWDVSATESIRQSFVANQKKLERERAEKEKRQSEEMSEALEAAQRKLKVASAEVVRAQKLVAEYRQQQASLAQKGEAEKMAEVRVLLERAESKRESAQRIRLDLDWQVKRARLKLRDFENKLRRRRRKNGEEATVKPDQIILLRDLADVVTKDVGGQRREDGRWPLVFDPSGQAATFFTYCGAACFDVEDLAVLTCSDVLEEQRRLLFALLKHMMYGGAVAIHLGDDFSKMSIVEEAFNSIEPGLFQTLTDRSVLYSYMLPRRFMSLVPEDLEKEYSQYMFEDEMLSKFVLAFVVSSEEPEMEVMERDCHSYYIVKVSDPHAGTADLEEE